MSFGPIFNAQLHLARGEALVGLGRLDEGVLETYRPIRRMPRLIDAISEEHIQYDAITRVFGLAGDVDAFVEQLVDYLKLNQNPRLESVRDDPRFQALVEMYR